MKSVGNFLLAFLLSFVFQMVVGRSSECQSEYVVYTTVCAYIVYSQRTHTFLCWKKNLHFLVTSISFRSNAAAAADDDVGFINRILKFFLFVLL